MESHYKNRLQEYCQKDGRPLPTYRVKEKSGPDHAPKFQVLVVFYLNKFQ
jgi:ribonuclease-3